MFFHKHNFRKDGLNLWCECGKIKKLDCSHKWKLHKESEINYKKDFAYGQETCLYTIQTLICENCGEIKQINHSAPIFEI